MTDQHSPLSFNIRCTACYGTEVWTLRHISRLLIAAGKLPPTSTTDIELIAEQFIAHHKKILCPHCNRINVLIVQRVEPDK